ncbi:MAG: histidine phosphatase family protein [Chloroflexota bacterium]|nr:histidine phosphatase family protein [Chloroflexota bacterium]
MNLFVMRHGPAEMKRMGMADEDRALTPQGRAQTVAVARGLKRLGVAPVAVLSSPLKRALETADLVAGEILQQGKPLPEESLTAGARPEHIVRALKGHEEDLLIVGHNPDLAHLLAFLLAGGEEIGIDLGTASVAAIEFPRTARKGSGVLQWHLRREQLALLGS